MSDIFTLEDLSELGDSEREVYAEGILLAGQIVVFVGREKSGKSYFADQFTIHTAAGEDWGDRIAIPKPRRSLVVQTEGSKYDLEERTTELYKKYPKAQENWASYMPDVLDIRKGEGIPELEEVMNDFQPEIVVLDSLYTSMSGSVRNDEHITAFKYNLKKIQLKFPKCSFIILHHEHRPKRNQQGDLYETSKERFAGSYLIMAMADISWHLTKDSNQHSETRYFEVDNVRARHMGIQPFFIDMDEATGILSSNSYQLGDSMLSMRLRLKSQSTVDKLEFTEWCTEEKHISRSQVYKNIKKMLEAKHIKEITDPDGKKLLEWAGE